MTDDPLAKLMLSVTLPVLTITGSLYYQAITRYKSRNRKAILKFRFVSLTVYLVLVALFMGTTLLVWSSAPHSGVQYGQAPLAILFLVNTTLFVRFFFWVSDSAIVARSTPRRINPLRESELRRQSRMTVPFNPEVTLRLSRPLSGDGDISGGGPLDYTITVVKTKEPKEPEIIHRPTRFEREDVI